jgi:hypothetical protein
MVEPLDEHGSVDVVETDLFNGNPFLVAKETQEQRERVGRSGSY